MYLYMYVYGPFFNQFPIPSSECSLLTTTKQNAEENFYNCCHVVLYIYMGGGNTLTNIEDISKIYYHK
jgi:hypothetical protein